MAKYYGAIGYAETLETDPDIWEEVITERFYYGDIVNNSRSLQSSDNVNDNVNISMGLSIVSDPYAIQNFHAIRYAEYLGTKWKVTSVDVSFPRLTLNLGGVYNENKT